VGASDLVVVSNRGPRSFTMDDAGLPVSSGPAGGLAGTLEPLLRGSGATWVACAMSEADRAAAAMGLMSDDTLDVAMVEPDDDTFRLAYDVVSNATVWFVHHHLFDLLHRPRFDGRWFEAWDAYRTYNEAFARRTSEVAADGAVVLVQDYHLALVPRLLATARPDLRTVHFSHTPFADPGILRVLPTAPCREMLDGMAGARACGFHTARWRDAFVAGCEQNGVGPPETFVAPLGPDPEYLAARAASPASVAARRRVDELVDNRQLVLRVDRVEPSKNFLRGFWALDELLRREPSWRGSFVFVALAYPSRQTLPEYLAYGTEVDLAVERINETWGTETWVPVILDVADDADRSFAALTRYDALVVNPLRDGLNLVAKEGPVVNTTDGALVLSREAGAFDELAPAALEVNPFDISQTADALARALRMTREERAGRSAELKRLVARRTARDWLDDQLAAAGA
jgi:trehalose 6-phosphate synthase